MNTEDDSLTMDMVDIDMSNKKKVIFLSLFFSILLKTFALDPPPPELTLLKELIGGVDTPVDLIVSKFGDNFRYSEINVYKQIPNASETDKMLVYEYDGLKFMYFKSIERNKQFMYFWEISSNCYLDGSLLYLGMPHKEFLKTFKSPHNSYDGYESYNFPDGDLFLEFNHTSSLLENVFWSIGD